MSSEGFTIGDPVATPSKLLVGVFTGYPKAVVWVSGRFYVEFAGIYRDLRNPVLTMVPDGGLDTPQEAQALTENDVALVEAFTP
jgi:hypothetical protein